MNTVKVLPVMSRSVQEELGYDHAGKVECSLLAALIQDRLLVNKERIADGEWFAQSTSDYSADYGRLYWTGALKNSSAKLYSITIALFKRSQMLFILVVGIKFSP